MSTCIRIGTRDSELALWQAHTVEAHLNALGYETEIVAVKSTGDLILDKPLYELGITGIFTKTLDIAMINGQVDIAVHSMKDVPTALPRGIVQAAALERADVSDILVYKTNLDFLGSEGTIATGSLRRRAQWLHRYPHHGVEDLRGNVNTRLAKLADNDWNGAIFAAAGLERIDKTPPKHIVLDWMLPAPAQGAMVVVAMAEDLFCREAVGKLNDFDTEIATRVERDFLRKLEGGCTAPIGALATIERNEIRFRGALFSLDGTQKVEIERTAPTTHYAAFGTECAEVILANGGVSVMEQIRRELKEKES